eukprot:COSAG01_NODE_6955_length_3419_cov_95.063855_5_plen_158_part_00
MVGPWHFPRRPPPPWVSTYISTLRSSSGLTAPTALATPAIPGTARARERRGQVGRGVPVSQGAGQSKRGGKAGKVAAEQQSSSTRLVHGSPHLNELAACAGAEGVVLLEDARHDGVVQHLACPRALARRHKVCSYAWRGIYGDGSIAHCHALSDRSS